MKKFKQIFLILLSIIPCAIFFSGCSFFDQKIYVTNIKATEIVGTTTTYTVYYSNGTHSMFTVENGTNGNNGQDLTLESIKKYCQDNNIDFNSFLKEYLTIVDKAENVQQATALAIQSAVSVWCEFPVSDFYTKDTSVSCGAGVIYQMNETYSYVITNYHVVYYEKCDTENNIANKIHLFQYGTTEHVYDTGSYNNQGYPKYGYGYGAVEAEFVGGSLNYDIAILKVATQDLLEFNEHATAVTIAQEYSLAETAIAIGNPETEGISVTSGIISVESEKITMLGADDKTQCTFRVMRIDTAVNGGNSGGGLFNINGELIGIVNAKVIDSQIDNIAYAIPFNNVVQVANNLIYQHEKTGDIAKVKTFRLDIVTFIDSSRSVYNPTTKKITIKEDVIVHSVSLTSNSNHGMGVGYMMKIQTGDKIKSISINGETHTINRDFELGDWLLSIRPGDKVLIKVIRDNDEQTLGFAEDAGVLESYFTEIK
ncbi:MAG: serine protease [Clostridia bacterium]|nr:serine protease [Clostridia bacterium]